MARLCTFEENQQRARNHLKRQPEFFLSLILELKKAKPKWKNKLKAESRKSETQIKLLFKFSTIYRKRKKIKEKTTFLLKVY